MEESTSLVVEMGGDGRTWYREEVLRRWLQGMESVL